MKINPNVPGVQHQINQQNVKRQNGSEARSKGSKEVEYIPSSNADKESNL